MTNIVHSNTCTTSIIPTTWLFRVHTEINQRRFMLNCLARWLFDVCSQSTSFCSHKTIVFPLKFVDLQSSLENNSSRTEKKLTTATATDKNVLRNVRCELARTQCQRLEYKWKMSVCVSVVCCSSVPCGIISVDIFRCVPNSIVLLVIHLILWYWQFSRPIKRRPNSVQNVFLFYWTAFAGKTL